MQIFLSFILSLILFLSPLLSAAEINLLVCDDLAILDSCCDEMQETIEDCEQCNYACEQSIQTSLSIIDKNRNTIPDFLTTITTIKLFISYFSTIPTAIYRPPISLA